ncbi:MAG: CHAD domain-containing protein [Bacteroidetes bacterium]|nr:MAG: CHAD domain-containing protein [Bacteroidota bacterium]
MELDYVKLKEIKPVLAGYIRESQSLLKLSSSPDEKVVHDVRVLLKKSRAALKLSGPQLDMESLNRDIRSLREAGQIMRFWREISVQRKILKELKKEYPVIFDGLYENEKLTALLKKTEPVPEPSEEIKTGLEKIEELLNKTGYRIRFQSMDTIDPQQLLKKLDLTYSSVVDIYLISRNNPKPENLHDFRKKTKTFLYQLYFFRPLNPSVVKALEKKLENLTQNLGKFNDLAQLIKALEYKYSDGANLPALDELIVKIREKQDGYLGKTWPTAYKIFCPGQKLVNVLGFKLLVI